MLAGTLLAPTLLTATLLTPTLRTATLLTAAAEGCGLWGAAGSGRIVAGMGLAGGERTRRRRVLITAAVMLAVVVTACAPSRDDLAGGPAPSEEPPSASASARSGSGSVSYTDVTFAELLVAHDRQTVRLCELLLAKPSVDPTIRAVAERMRANRSQEINQLITWLAGWGLDEEPVAHDHVSQSHGLLLPGQLLSFQRSDGPGAQTAFLEVMITRDRGIRDLAGQAGTTADDSQLAAIAARAVAIGDAEMAELQRLSGRR